MREKTNEVWQQKTNEVWHKELMKGERKYLTEVS